MFEIGEHIVYGTSGICRVEEICPSPHDKADERLFYLLVPVHNPMSATIYTPVDNDRVPMRRLMSPQEIEALILAIPEIGELEVPQEKQRRELYRSTVASLCPRGYVCVMKTVEGRRVSLGAAHKHFPVSDMEYGRLARQMLYSELSHVLGVPMEDVEAYIAARLPRAE